MGSSLINKPAQPVQLHPLRIISHTLGSYKNQFCFHILTELSKQIMLGNLMAESNG